MINLYVTNKDLQDSPKNKLIILVITMKGVKNTRFDIIFFKGIFEQNIKTIFKTKNIA